MSLTELLVLSAAVACVSWTITHEEILRELREFAAYVARDEGVSPALRKLAYMLTCEYCLSHWVTAGFLVVTGYKLLLDDWRGYVLSLFVTVWVANVYMSVYALLRVDLRWWRKEVERKEQ